ncbi:hypothetical protein R1sor_024837 [Riccia sorocarpa]|uniref:Mitochondrial import inner membrane translocase subunit TIM50 n=1 Tax=Riccia sorocarpa TaxID=122646 RepID=A0ABD3GVR2_9MARC
MTCENIRGTDEIRDEIMIDFHILFFVVLVPLRRADVLEREMQQRLLHALQMEDQMDVRLNEKKAELAELERLVAEERRLFEETAHRRKEEERRLETEEHFEASQHGWDVLQVKKGCFVVVRSGLSEFLQACLREFHLMIWTSRPRAVIDRILRFLFKSKKISFDLAYHENCTVWSREQCFDLGGKTSRPLYYKDFDMLYEHNISARDILIVEDEVAKIGTNNVMNALVPRRWDLSVETPSSSFLMDHLLPFLTTWRSSLKGTVEFVEKTRPCTYEKRKSLRQIWTSITVRHASQVESVALVEGATPVESIARVESATPVLSAALVALEQPSAPISSVVDVAHVPCTS